MGGGDKETLGGVVEHARAVAEVALAQGVDFGEVSVQLLAESGGHVRVDYVVGEEVEYVLPFVDGFDDALVQQVAVDVVEFVGDGWQAPGRGGLGGVEPLAAVEEKPEVGLAEVCCQAEQCRGMEKGLLGRQVVLRLAAAVGEEGEGGFDVVDGVVRVGAFEVEGFEQPLEFVHPQTGLDKPGKFEGVETLAVAELYAEGAVDIVGEDVEVELDVVADKGMALAVVEETAETFAAAEPFAVEIDGEHGVFVAAHHRGNLFGGLDNDVEVGAFDIVSVGHFDGGYLYDVVAEDVEAGGLGVEEDNLFVVEHLDEVLQVGVAVVDEEVGGRDGAGAQLAHEVAGDGVLGNDVEQVEQAGPGDEAGLVGDDVEMGEEELHGGGGEEVAPGDFEMGCVAEFKAQPVGIGVGGDDDGHTPVGVEGGIAVCQRHGQAVLVGHGTPAEGAGGAVVGAAEFVLAVEVGEVVVTGVESAEVGRLGRGAVGGGGQEVAADAELRGGIGVEEVEQVVGRAVVLSQMVEVGTATVFELFEGVEFGSHEGEDGLLLVAQIDGGGVGGGEEVDNGHLEEVEVLHLVDL